MDGVLREGGNRPTHRLRMRTRVADNREVAVAREAHVVELDLVEAGFRGGGGDVHVVAPDPAVVRVRPAEARVVQPEGAVAAMHRQLGPLRREHRILERDDAADQVDPVLMRQAHDLLRVVVRGGGSDLVRQRHARMVEADTPVLVLDVELDRVQARDDEVLLKLPGQRAQRHRDVHAADLVRDERPAVRTGHGMGPLRRRGGRLLAAAADRPRAERNACNESQQNGHGDRPPDPNLTPAPGSPALAGCSIPVGRVHRKGAQAYALRRIAPWFSPTGRSAGCSRKGASASTPTTRGCCNPPAWTYGSTASSASSTTRATRSSTSRSRRRT